MGELPATFFGLTPRLYVAVADGRARKAMREFNLLAWLAHTTASLDRAKKIPPLKSLVSGDKPKRKPLTAPRPVGELLSLCRSWQAAIPRPEAQPDQGVSLGLPEASQ